MAKDRAWVDYANVAANAVQTAELDSINSKMRQMAGLELQKEYREQQEAAVAECENILREAVFFYSEQLRDLEETASQNPVAAYIRACHLKRTYENMPQFKSSGFRKFEDKERLANVQRAYDRMIRDSVARLKPEELEKCNRCIDHILERNDLLQLIAVQEKREKLTQAKESLPARQGAKQAELEKVKEEQQQKGPVLLLICKGLALLGLCAVCLTGLVTVLFDIFGGRFAGIESNTWMFVLFGSGSVLGGLFYMTQNSPYARRQAVIALRAVALQAELAEMANAITAWEKKINQHKSLHEKFGVAKSSDYQQMLLERDTLLTQMLGDCAKGFIERKVAPSGDLFDLVLVEVELSKQIQVQTVIQASMNPDFVPADVVVLPSCLLYGVSKVYAEAAARALEAAGAKVEVRPAREIV